MSVVSCSLPLKGAGNCPATVALGALHRSLRRLRGLAAFPCWRPSCANSFGVWNVISTKGRGAGYLDAPHPAKPSHRKAVFQRHRNRPQCFRIRFLKSHRCLSERTVFSGFARFKVSTPFFTKVTKMSRMPSSKGGLKTSCPFAARIVSGSGR
jgi:hypothetical protein